MERSAQRLHVAFRSVRKFNRSNMNYNLNYGDLSEDNNFSGHIQAIKWHASEIASKMVKDGLIDKKTNKYILSSLFNDNRTS